MYRTLRQELPLSRVRVFEGKRRNLLLLFEMMTLGNDLRPSRDEPTVPTLNRFGTRTRPVSEQDVAREAHCVISDIR